MGHLGKVGLSKIQNSRSVPYIMMKKEILNTLKVESFAGRNFPRYRLSRTPTFKLSFAGINFREP